MSRNPFSKGFLFPGRILMENKITASNSKWYTIKELSSLCGLKERSCKNIISRLKSMESFQNDLIKYHSLGYRKGVEALYAEEILKALKRYQLRNSVPNALKDKETAVSGNISVIQNKAARQTIDSLMDNPDTLQLMLTASIERQQKLLLENSKLKESNKALSIEKETLRITLDESKEWYSVKRMEKLNQGQRFSWKLLKNESRRLGVPVKKVFDQNYGEVNAYHISVWESLYFDTLSYAD